jgi:hypothetical protein
MLRRRPKSSPTVPTPENLLIPRIPFASKTENRSNDLPRSRIKSRIGGKTNKRDLKTHNTATLPTSTALPESGLLPPPQSPCAASEIIAPQLDEHVFDISGPKNYLLEEGPVFLMPYQNRSAEGGYTVEVRRGGKKVGVIAAGGELACRKLLVNPL